MKIADPLIHYDVIGKRYRNHETGDAPAGIRTQVKSSGGF